LEVDGKSLPSSRKGKRQYGTPKGKSRAKIKHRKFKGKSARRDPK